jgi:hypothetical protein
VVAVPVEQFRRASPPPYAFARAGVPRPGVDQQRRRRPVQVLARVEVPAHRLHPPPARCSSGGRRVRVPLGVLTASSVRGARGSPSRSCRTCRRHYSDSPLSTGQPVPFCTVLASCTVPIRSRSHLFAPLAIFCGSRKFLGAKGSLCWSAKTTSTVRDREVASSNLVAPTCQKSVADKW